MMNFKDKFQELSEKWKEETAFYSSMSRITGHWAYQEIIKMGPEVVPFIIAELEKEPKWWHTALKAITGANPVPDEHRGKIKLIAEDWIHWFNKTRQDDI